jgi:predicted N-acetyltransferase YhbS
MQNAVVTIRRLEWADVPAADQILASAYHGAESRQVDLQRYLALEPEGWLLACRGSEAIGLVGAINYGSFAYLGLMTVHERAQRQGIGRQLMEILLAGLDARGCPMVLLDATEPGAGLYSQMGFVEDGQTAHFVRSGDPPMVSGFPEEVSPMLAEDIPALVALDEAIFGARREQVLAIFHSEFPGRAFVARDQAGRERGFLFAQSGRLGPWVAWDVQAAESLLQAALSLPFRTDQHVILPARNTLAAGLLLRYGFKPLEQLRHMRRGGAALPGQPERLYGQASYAIG